jgi:hypothetical protein
MAVALFLSFREEIKAIRTNNTTFLKRRKEMKRMFATLLGMAVIILTGNFAAYGEGIPPVSVSGTLLNRLIDGTFPAEGSVYTGSPCVSWTGEDPIFTADLGRKYIIEDLLLSVDNNDDYAIEYSENTNDWIPLIKVDWRYGEIRWGMETLSTIAGDPEYVSGIDFAPVEARYIRIFATGGDDKYAVGEIMAYGYAAAPEIHINILPGITPNIMGFCRLGRIPVVVWGSADFDVTTVDVGQLTLSIAEIGQTGSHVYCTRSDVGSYNPDAFDSIGLPDGHVDLTCYFNMSAIRGLDSISNEIQLAITGCNTPFISCTEGSAGFYQTTAADSATIQNRCNGEKL